MLTARDFIERQAINRLVAQLFNTHRSIVSRVVQEGGQSDNAWATWREHNAGAANAAIENIDAILASRPFDLARFAVAQGALANLAGR
jgi:NAD-specific glutamate dehydrogenase